MKDGGKSRPASVKFLLQISGQGIEIVPYEFVALRQQTLFATPEAGDGAENSRLWIHCRDYPNGPVFHESDGVSYDANKSTLMQVQPLRNHRIETAVKTVRSISRIFSTGIRPLEL